MVQLAALALSAGRVPLSADFPDPAERLAPQVMLATQVMAAGLLFPWLLAGDRSAVLAGATAGPMALAAGHLADAPVGRSLLSLAWLWMWVLDLALLRSALPRSRRWDGVAVAAVGLLTAGPAVLLFLLADFAPGPAGGGRTAAGAVLRSLPLAATGSVSASPSGSFFAWANLFLLAFILATACRLARPRADDTLSTPAPPGDIA